jgi:hypothetical protein
MILPDKNFAVTQRLSKTEVTLAKLTRKLKRYFSGLPASALPFVVSI